MTFTELFWERSEKSCQFPAWVRSPCYPHHHILCRFTLTTAFCPRLNNWLSLPTKWEASLAWMHPLYKSLHSAYGAYVAAHTNTHTHTLVLGRTNAYLAQYTRQLSHLCRVLIFSPRAFSQLQNIFYHYSVVMIFLCSFFSLSSDVIMSFSRSDVLVTYSTRLLSFISYSLWRYLWLFFIMES